MKQISLALVHLRTKLIPELSALVGHGRALRLPEEEPRVGKELVRDKCQHS